MIKVNELRVGNTVLNKAGDPSEVVSIDRESIHIRTGGEYGDYERWYCESVNPIPLTPEILEKCGFELTERGEWGIGGFEVRLSGKQFYYSEYLPNSPELKSLHQLQNLYFALTGEELEVKL